MDNKSSKDKSRLWERLLGDDDLQPIFEEEAARIPGYRDMRARFMARLKSEQQKLTDPTHPGKPQGSGRVVWSVAASVLVMLTLAVLTEKVISASDLVSRGQVGFSGDRWPCLAVVALVGAVFLFGLSCLWMRRSTLSAGVLVVTTLFLSGGCAGSVQSIWASFAPRSPGPISGVVPSPLQFSPETSVLLVGISEFESGAVRSLPSGSASAVGLEDLLVSRAIPPENISTLVDGQATRGAIEDALQAAFDRADGASLQAKKQVIIYLGSHAWPDYASGATHFVAYDTDVRALDTTGLSFSRIEAMLQANSAKARRTLVILDTCYSGQLRPFQPDGAFRLAVLASSRCDQESFDKEDLEDRKGSALCLALQGALRSNSADLDRVNAITLRELHGYVVGAVEEVTGHNQTPQLFSGSSPAWRDHAPLLGEAPTKPRSGSLCVSAGVPGVRFFLDDVDLGLAPRGSLELEDLPAGRHRLAVEYPSGLRRESAVVIRADEVAEVQLDEELDTRPEAVGVVSDVLPGHDVLFRPVAARPNLPVSIREDESGQPYAGRACVGVSIDLTSADWNGVYWLAHGEYGTRPGLDLEALLRPGPDERVLLEWRARGVRGGERVQFKVGGSLQGSHQDSIQFPLTTGVVELDTDWSAFSIDVTGQPLDQISRAFVVVARRSDNGGSIDLEIDEVRFSRHRISRHRR